MNYPNFFAPKPDTFTASIAMDKTQRQLLFMAASLLLKYPESEHESQQAGAEQIWQLVRQQLPQLAQPVQLELAAFLDYAQEKGLRALQIEYVESFDQRRRCSMYLSYYSVGDTRQRGMAILAFKEQLEALGFTFAEDELPDHLCVVLEAAAKADGSEHEEITQLLAAHRDGIEVLKSALEQFSPAYAHVVRAVCMGLPEVSEAVVENYAKLIRSGPPAELVGLGMPFWGNA